MTPRVRRRRGERLMVWVAEPHPIPYLNTIQNPIFQQDNARLHQPVDESS
ncbi:unnamed protein product [Acanthoscelides obtectus]|uniref:Uncharacterized protein n=1 Tax=Acanthoscelides obtectus TaxID=200917 RepID=A0A9P0PST3_ACAOB|nr:unnamed protein product [Acanthoscelides obtectus]CAK1663048.1 hypothetical protein AOBTE_LOCUS23454 [Acanthoscelides obtectus]